MFGPNDFTDQTKLISPLENSILGLASIAGAGVFASAWRFQGIIPPMTPSVLWYNRSCLRQASFRVKGGSGQIGELQQAR